MKGEAKIDFIKPLPGRPLSGIDERQLRILIDASYEIEEKILREAHTTYSSEDKDQKNLQRMFRCFCRYYLYWHIDQLRAFWNPYNNMRGIDRYFDSFRKKLAYEPNYKEILHACNLLDINYKRRLAGNTC